MNSFFHQPRQQRIENGHVCFIILINDSRKSSQKYNLSLAGKMKNPDYFCANFYDMVFFPNAKINLGLFVSTKRIDGYHNIESVLFPVGLCDALEIAASPDSKFHFSTSGLYIPGNPEDNLIVKAWKMICRDFNLPPVQIQLHKVIPMGAGLGGGSSDAAFAIRLINHHFDLGLTSEKMMNYATRLGMDCPFFILNKPARASERGDKLKALNLDLSGKFLVLVKPACHVKTIEAYAGLKPSQPDGEISEIITKPVSNWKMILKNDFEKTVFQKFPEIGEIKNQLYKSGALYASMSGSGSAVFGIFEHKIDLQKQFCNKFYWHEWLK